MTKANTEATASTEAETLPLSDKDASPARHVELPSGDAFTTESVDEIMRQVPTRVVVIGGTQDSGKTTLIGSIYERLRAGSFENIRFAGSRTLLAFERVAYPGRQESGLAAPDTERTSKAQGCQIAHLAIGTAACRCHLLLADMSGEWYENMRDHQDATENMKIIGRADHFSLLIDGERLADLRQRHQAFDDADTVLRRLLEAHLLSSNSLVTIVFSKWDIIQSAASELQTTEFCADCETRMRERYGSLIPRLRFARVIARDQSCGGQPATQGVLELVHYWCTESPVAAAHERVARHFSERLIDIYGSGLCERERR